MSQLDKRFIKDNAIDSTKLDKSYPYTMKGLTITPTGQLAVQNGIPVTTFSVDSDGNVICNDLRAKSVTSDGDETNFGNIIIAQGSPDSTWILEAGVLIPGDFQIRQAGAPTGSIYIDGNLNKITLKGDSSITGDATIIKNLYVGNDASVIRDTSSGRNLWIGQDASVIRDSSSGRNLWVGQDASVVHNLVVNNFIRYAPVYGRYFDTTMSSGTEIEIGTKGGTGFRLSTDSGADISIQPAGDLQIGGGGDTTFNPNGAISMEKTLYLTDFTSSGGMRVGTDATIGRDASVSRNLWIGNDAVINKSLTVNDNGLIRYIDVMGGSFLDTTKSTSTEFCINGYGGNDLRIATTGDLSLVSSGKIRIAGDATFVAGGAVYVDRDLTSSGSIRVNTNFSAGNDATIGRDASVTRNLWIGNDATIGRDASVTRYLWVGQDAFFAKNLQINNDLYLGGIEQGVYLNASGDVTANVYGTTATLEIQFADYYMFKEVINLDMEINLSQTTSALTGLEIILPVYLKCASKYINIPNSKEFIILNADPGTTKTRPVPCFFSDSTTLYVSQAIDDADNELNYLISGSKTRFEVNISYERG